MTATLVRFRQTPGVLSRSFGDEVILAPSRRDEYDSLSRTAGAVWNLLGEPRTLDEVVGVLEAAYGTSGVTIARDVEPLIADLVGRGLVERVHDGDG